MDSVGQVTGLSSGVDEAGVLSGVTMAEGVPSAPAMGEEGFMVQHPRAAHGLQRKRYVYCVRLFAI